MAKASLVDSLCRRRMAGAALWRLLNQFVHYKLLRGRVVSSMHWHQSHPELEAELLLVLSAK